MLILYDGITVYHFSMPAFFAPLSVSFTHILWWNYSLCIWTTELGSTLWIHHCLLLYFSWWTLSSSQQRCSEQPGEYEWEFLHGLYLRIGFLGLAYKVFRKVFRDMVAFHLARPLKFFSVRTSPCCLVPKPFHVFAWSIWLLWTSGLSTSRFLSDIWHCERVTVTSCDKCYLSDTPKVLVVRTGDSS